MSSSASIECWQARRRREATLFEKSTDIATQPALRFAKRSTKSRTLNSATSRRAKSLESLRLDHHSTAARQPRQRQSKHGSQDEGGQGSFGTEHIAPRIDYFRLER